LEWRPSWEYVSDGISVIVNSRPWPDLSEGDGKENFEMLQALRRMGLRETSPKENWVRECGVDWTEFFFNEERNAVESGEIEYGKGPKFNTAFADYWKYMASKSDS
jgi:hypothetical protein